MNEKLYVVVVAYQHPEDYVGTTGISPFFNTKEEAIKRMDAYIEESKISGVLGTGGEYHEDNWELDVREEYFSAKHAMKENLWVVYEIYEIQQEIT